MARLAEIIVLGARGRMGQMILRAMADSIAQSTEAGVPPVLRLAGAIELPNSPFIGHGTGVPGAEIQISDSLESVLGPGKVVIDFTSPQSTLQNLILCEKHQAGIVIGTTGLNEEGKSKIREAAKKIPVVFSPNMSMGVNVLFKAAEMVAKILGADFDVEIVEAHHNQKKDSPSGTALGLAEAIARGHQVRLEDKAIYGREGLSGARPKGQIGIHAVRGGDIVGDHTVLFAGAGERIELKHMAHSRQTFAQGAVRAAQFLAGNKAGLYTMTDVLGL